MVKFKIMRPKKTIALKSADLKLSNLKSDRGKKPQTMDIHMTLFS